MKSVTFTISKGGVGKSLVTANVGAALAQRKKKVVLVEGDPNHPLQTILGVSVGNRNLRLDDVVEKNLDIEDAVCPTSRDNLFLIPSGISLQSYFDLNPLGFAKKLTSIKADFIFIDVPFPLGKAAILSLGISQYFIPILTEDEFALCVESAIDTIRLGRYYLRSTPIGFVINRIRNPEKFHLRFIKDLENLLEIPCIAKIMEDKEVLSSYGGIRSAKAFVAYATTAGDFPASIDKIADALSGDLPKPDKEDVTELLKQIIKD